MPRLVMRIGLFATLFCVVMLASVSTSAARDWRPANSQLRIKAELDAFDGKTVSLKLAGSDNVIRFPLEKLSAEDQAYLKKTYPNGKKSDRKPEDKPAEPDTAKPVPEEPTPKKPPAAPAKANKPASPAARLARLNPTTITKAKPGDFDVEIVSLTITKSPGSEGGGVAGLIPGTRATVFVASHAKSLLAVDAQKTNVACADDRATKLSQPPSGGDAAAVDDGPTLEVAPDGKSGLIVFDFPRPPTTKATRIRLKGELHLICGTEEQPETVVLPMELIVSLGL